MIKRKIIIQHCFSIPYELNILLFVELKETNNHINIYKIKSKNKLNYYFCAISTDLFLQFSWKKS